MRVALKIFWWLRKGRTVVSTRQTGEFGEGEWRPTRPRVSPTCHPVLHLSRPSLVSHSVCNLQSALRHHHSISIQCIPFTPPNKFNSKPPDIKKNQPRKYKSRNKMSKHPQESDIYAQLAAKDNNPEPLKKVLAREQANYDCLSCRVMGVYLLNCTLFFC